MARTQIGALALLMFLFAGCGSNATRIAGTVTFDGTPVEQGSISFEPVDGKGTVFGGPITAGKYEINVGLPIGEQDKLVRIIGVRKTGRKLRNPESATEMVEEVEMFIPQQYNSDSTQKVQVKANLKNTHNFDLKSIVSTKSR